MMFTPEPTSVVALYQLRERSKCDVGLMRKDALRRFQEGGYRFAGVLMFRTDGRTQDEVLAEALRRTRAVDGPWRCGVSRAQPNDILGLEQKLYLVREDKCPVLASHHYAGVERKLERLDRGGQWKPVEMWQLRTGAVFRAKEGDGAPVFGGRPLVATGNARYRYEAGMWSIECEYAAPGGSANTEEEGVIADFGGEALCL